MRYRDPNPPRLRRLAPYNLPKLRQAAPRTNGFFHGGWTTGSATRWKKPQGLGPGPARRSTGGPFFPGAPLRRQ